MASRSISSSCVPSGAPLRHASRLRRRLRLRTAAAGRRHRSHRRSTASARARGCSRARGRCRETDMPEQRACAPGVRCGVRHALAIARAVSTCDARASAMSSPRSRSGGTLQADHVDAVEQVFAELALCDQLAEILVGGATGCARRPGSRRLADRAARSFPGSRAAASLACAAAGRRLRRGTACRPRRSGSGLPCRRRRR